jgi:hypothetical protein
MDANRFDEFAASLADAGTSRRSVLARLVRGVFAAVLAMLGMSGFGDEAAGARKKGGKRGKGGKGGKRGSGGKAKSCPQRCRKTWGKKGGKGAGKRGGKKGGKKGGGKRRQQSKQACLARCNQGGGSTQAKPSFPIPPGGPSVECTVGIGGAGCTSGLICTPSVPGGTIGVCLGPCTTPGTEDTCGSGNTCTTVNGLIVCLPASVGITECETGAQCLATGFCDETAGLCALCPEICGDPSDAVCCAVGFECVDSTGECVVSAGR